MADQTGVQVFVGPANQLELGTVTEGPTAVTLETVSDRLQRLNFTISAPTADVLTAAQDAATEAANSATAAAGSLTAAQAAQTAATGAQTAATTSATAAAAAVANAADAVAAAGGGGFAFDPADEDILIISTRTDGSITVDGTDPDVLVITA